MHETFSQALAANDLKRPSQLGEIPVMQFLKLFFLPKDFENGCL